MHRSSCTSSSQERDLVGLLSPFCFSAACSPRGSAGLRIDILAQRDIDGFLRRPAIGPRTRVRQRSRSLDLRAPIATVSRSICGLFRLLARVVCSPSSRAVQPAGSEAPNPLELAIAIGTRHVGRDRLIHLNVHRPAAIARDPPCQPVPPIANTNRVFCVRIAKCFQLMISARQDQATVAERGIDDLRTRPRERIKSSANANARPLLD